jgi:thiosulfate/3-mercaptopyruvate sulfurtransferase
MDAVVMQKNSASPLRFSLFFGKLCETLCKESFMASPLVSAEWLADHLSDTDLRVVDASWWMPNANRDGRAEYSQAHIPGAVFFDIDAVSDHSTGLPHMLPSPDVFAEAVGKLGISHTDTIVVYDAAGLFSAPRVWWMFKIMGAKNVFVLDGGLPKWQSGGHPVESGISTPNRAVFKPLFQAGAVADYDDVDEATRNEDAAIVDARAAARFNGDAPEPRAGVRSGHIPASFNLPFGKLLNEDGTMKNPEAIRAAFGEAGVDLGKDIITSCGSGVTAAVLTLGLETAGKTDVRLYDGSWSEWGSR